MKVLLIGYYGYKNLGDDLMLEGLLRQLLSNYEDIEIRVPVAEKYFNSIDKRLDYVSLPSSLLAWLKLIRTVDRVIWGGGTCIYPNSGLLWLFLISVFSFLFRKKIYFLSIGVEKANRFWDFWMIRTILHIAHFISLRDKESYGIVKNIYKVSDKKLLLSYDLAYLMMESLPKVNSPSSNLNNISFSGHYGFCESQTIKIYAKLLDELCDRNNEMKIHFLPAHGGVKTDDLQHKAICSLMNEKHKKQIVFYNDLSVSQYLSIISKMDFHIGFRLHSLFIAESLNIPYLAVSYADKVRIFASMHRRDFFLVDDEVTLEDVDRINNSYLYKDYIKEKSTESILDNLRLCVKIALL